MSSNKLWFQFLMKGMIFSEFPYFWLRDNVKHNVIIIISQDFCRLTVNLTVRMLFVKSGINILLSLLKLFFIPLPTNNILAAGFQYITVENLSNLGKDLCGQNRVVWITKQGSGACYATSEIICSNVERKFFCW